MSRKSRLLEARSILSDLGLPKQQQNDRTALCLLALLNLTPKKRWQDSESPLVGITPIMDWAREHYEKDYAPNTRETVRRQSMHQLVQAGIVLYNPDKPGRPVNSPHAVYQIAPEILKLLRTYRTGEFGANLEAYRSIHRSLAELYAKERQMAMVPVKVREGRTIALSAGDHSLLLKAIVEEFAPRFISEGRLIYVGDTGDKVGYFRLGIPGSARRETGPSWQTA